MRASCCYAEIGIFAVRSKHGVGNVVMSYCSAAKNREEVVVKKPLYGKDDGHWHYYNNDDEHQYGVRELDPVRIKFLKSGFIHLCFNKVTLNGNKTKCLF